MELRLLPTVGVCCYALSLVLAVASCTSAQEITPPAEPDWPHEPVIQPLALGRTPTPQSQIAIQYRCGLFRQCDLSDYMARQHVCALFVISRGEPVLHWVSGMEACQDDVARERYGIASVTKSIVSLLFGMVLENPAFGRPLDLNTPAAEPLRVAGLEYPNSSVSVRQLLQMSSGMKCSEDETQEILRVLAHSDGSQASRFSLLKDAAKYRLAGAEFEPAPRFNYSGFDTQLLGMLIEDRLDDSRAFPRPTLDEAVERLLWKVVGAVRPAEWNADFAGHPPAYCCFNAAAGDLAKLGDWILQRYRIGSDTTARWIWQSVADRVDARWQCRFYGETHRFEYGYQWWIPSGDRDGFTGIGTGGQYLHLFPEQDVVVVQLGAREPDDRDTCETMLVHRMIANSVSRNP